MKILLLFYIFNTITHNFNFNTIRLHFHYNNLKNYKNFIFTVFSNELKYIKQFKYSSNVKRKSLVNMSNKKIYNQKGTGRSRIHTKSVPNCRGGGIAFGPFPYKYKLKVNNKELFIVKQILLFNKRNKIFIINRIPNKNVFKLLGISTIEQQYLLILNSKLTNYLNLNCLKILLSNLILIIL